MKKPDEKTKQKFPFWLLILILSLGLLLACFLILPLITKHNKIPEKLNFGYNFYYIFGIK